ncbi:MAG: TetR/AcrR family transcriptional regulator [Pseudomonadota bacterium]
MSLEASKKQHTNRRMTVKEYTAATPPDGRHLRSERSRQQIVNALMELMREGNMEPTQAAVAERANVSFRTVSRHYEDMEVLYRHCVHQLQRKLLHEFLLPFESAHWRDRVDELIDRRAEAYDVFLPYRAFASVRRFRSDYMNQVVDDDVAFEVSTLDAVLPKHIHEDRVLVDALENSLSFDGWLRLRRDRQFSSEHAKAVLKRTAASLLEQHKD